MYHIPPPDFILLQWRVQNAEKVTHIKGRLLDQAMVLSHYVPFQIEKLSKRKEFAPRGSEFFLLRAIHYDMINHFYHIGWPPLNVTILVTHVRNCVMGATPMG